jgi:hypothetical protein
MGRGPQLFTLDGVPAGGKTAEQVEDALRAEVARVAREGVSEAELERVKTQWMASEVYKRDSVMNQAQELGSNWVQGLPLDAEERLLARCAPSPRRCRPWPPSILATTSSPWPRCCPSRSIRPASAPHHPRRPRH